MKKDIRICASLTCDNTFIYNLGGKRNCCSIECKHNFASQNKKREFKHCLNPTCFHFFIRTDSIQVYCTKHCSAVVNNSNRTEETIHKQKRSLKLTLERKSKQKVKVTLPYIKRVFVTVNIPKNLSKRQSKSFLSIYALKKIYNKEMKILHKDNFSKIFKCKCNECHSIFFAKSQTKFCREHFNKYSRDAKFLYRFKFNVYDYPDLFDTSLLSKIGFFSPGGPKYGPQNLQGYSRDHRVSVSEALKCNYDPFYISHPLNCELMLHSENSSKHSKSSITYIELQSLVDAYEKKRSP